MKKEIESFIIEAVKAGNYSVAGATNDSVTVKVGTEEESIEVVLCKTFAMFSAIIHSDVLSNVYLKEIGCNRKARLESLQREMDMIKADMEKDGECIQV